MAQETMDDILSEKPAVPEAPAPAAPEAPPDAGTPEPVERPTSRRKAHAEREALAQGKVRDPDTGQFRKVEEAAPEAPAPEAPKPEAPAPPAPAAPAQPEFTAREKAFLKGLEEERTKRQEAERKLKEAAPKEPEKTFWEDPEGALAKEREATERVRQETQQAVLNMRLQTAETIARSKHADFDEKIAVFSELAKTTPGLGQQWLASTDPAEYAYQLGKSHMELREAGGLEQLRAKIEKETRVKLEAEYAKKAQELEAQRAALPPTLTNAHASAAPKVVWGGPTSMKDILQ